LDEEEEEKVEVGSECNISPYLITLKDSSLSLAILSFIPLELYSSDFNLTFYCDNIVGTVPSLRHLATLAVTQALVRNQVTRNLLIQKYSVWQHIQHMA
jgi:hypothetical protein